MQVGIVAWRKKINTSTCNVFITCTFTSGLFDFHFTVHFNNTQPLKFKIQQIIAFFTVDMHFSPVFQFDILSEQGSR